MMDFMDNLRRGVDRAGFEVDRLLRANRVRSHIATIRSQIDDELRQVGRVVMELYDQGQTLPESLTERCERVRQYESEIAQRELELERINVELPPDVEASPAGPAPVPKCPNCGHVVHEGAKFCSNCGADLSALSGGEKPPRNSAQTDPGSGAPAAGPSEQTS